MASPNLAKIVANKRRPHLEAPGSSDVTARPAPFSGLRATLPATPCGCRWALVGRAVRVLEHVLHRHAESCGEAQGQ
jgi:hypothetical protein